MKLNRTMALRVNDLGHWSSLFFLLGGTIALAQAPATEPVLWYSAPAPVWTEALPIGNGCAGAMVFGGANIGANNGDQQDSRKNAALLDGNSTRGQDEHLQLNEDTLWSGSRANRLNPRAGEGFRKIRSLLLDSHGEDAAKIAEAEKLASETMIAIPRGMPPYSTLGDLYLRSKDTSVVSEYRRELNLNTGIVQVKYASGGIHFTREVLASVPDGILAIHIMADKPRSISFRVTMDRPEDFAVHVLGKRDLALTEGPEHKSQIRFQGQVRVLATHGRTYADGDAISVDRADDATILIALATDFKGGPIIGGDPAALCAQMLDAAEKKSFDRLRAAAVAEQRKWMDRAAFHLASADLALASLPTNERLRRVSEGKNDPGLQELYFQFARYLLLASSRSGGLPSNLQGLWASGIDNPWGSKWTVNVNTEMNYWLAEPGNLAPTTAPLFDLLDMARTPGYGTASKVAHDYYGAGGFVIHHNLDVWGDSEAIDGYGSGLWPMGGAWLTLHAWDHYAFSGDKEFLRKRAWPLLHDSSQFFLDYLVEDGEGHLVTGPSVSPENSYRLADGSTHALSMAPTMDIEIVRELFLRTVQAAELLDEEPEFREKLTSALAKLPPFKVGKLGQLQEWQQDYDDSDPGHRHISHLWALFPGTLINLQHTPELARAAQTTLERRLAHGGGQTGWSRAWVVNYWDHLGQGNKAYESLQVLLSRSTFPNLMDTHPPGVFQIDGNLGGASGMLEAVVQSRWYSDHCEVDLLPALPDEWRDGSVAGVRVRGGSEIALQWAGGKAKALAWRATQDEVFELRLPAGQQVSSILVRGVKQHMEKRPDGSMRFHAAKGEQYLIEF